MRFLPLIPWCCLKSDWVFISALAFHDQVIRAIVEAAVLQQPRGGIHLVQFLGYIAALGTGNQQFLAPIVNGAILWQFRAPWWRW